ncbi:(Fe-S)-binding protein [bacterium]|nr:(Fe-S)-binding protein [bacterium]
MKVAVFIPCYVDQIVPEVGKATVQLLRRLGMEVIYPSAQTCCGQPAFNTGFWAEAADVAKRQIKIFLDSGAEAIVSPSGSCSAMQSVFYPTLFHGTPEESAARDLASRTFELTQFIVHKLGLRDVGARFEGKGVLHRSCHSLRELNLRTEAQELLSNVQGLELVPMDADEECCGFGGTFSVKMSDISTAMGEVKLSAIERTDASWVISGDSSCLMHLGGMMSRRGMKVKPIHLAEVLASTG